MPNPWDVVSETAAPAASPDALAEQYSTQYGVDPDLIHAQMNQEDPTGDPQAVSKAGAIGHMQLMPDTARQLGVDPHVPEQNVQGGVRFMSMLLKKYGGNQTRALAAYNAGPGVVDDFLNGTNNTGKNPFKRVTPDGVPPFAETQQYVQKINAKISQRKAAAQKDTTASTDAHQWDVADEEDVSVFHNPDEKKNYLIPQSMQKEYVGKGFKAGLYEDSEPAWYDKYGLDIKGKATDDQLRSALKFDIETGRDKGAAPNQDIHDYAPTDDALRHAGIDVDAYHSNVHTNAMRRLKGLPTPDAPLGGLVGGVKAGIKGMFWDLPKAVYHSAVDDATDEEKQALGSDTRRGLLLMAKRLGWDPAMAEVDKAVDAWDAGHKIEAIGHLGAAAIPVLGPTAASVAEHGAQDPAAGIGEAMTYIVAPKLKVDPISLALRGAKAIAPKALSIVTGKTAVEPETVSANKFANNKGLPLTVGQAADPGVIGNTARAAEAFHRRVPGVASIYEGADKTANEAVIKSAREMADSIGPETYDPTKASTTYVGQKPEGMTEAPAPGEAVDAKAALRPQVEKQLFTDIRRSNVDLTDEQVQDQVNQRLDGAVDKHIADLQRTWSDARGQMEGIFKQSGLDEATFEGALNALKPEFPDMVNGATAFAVAPPGLKIAATLAALGRPAIARLYDYYKSKGVPGFGTPAGDLVRNNLQASIMELGKGKGLQSTAGAFASKTVKDIGKAVKSRVSPITDSAQDIGSGIQSTIKSFGSGMPRNASDAVDAVKKAAQSVGDLSTSIKSGIERLKLDRLKNKANAAQAEASRATGEDYRSGHGYPGLKDEGAYVSDDPNFEARNAAHKAVIATAQHVEAAANSYDAVKAQFDEFKKANPDATVNPHADALNDAYGEVHRANAAHDAAQSTYDKVGQMPEPAKGSPHFDQAKKEWMGAHPGEDPYSNEGISSIATHAAELQRAAGDVSMETPSSFRYSVKTGLEKGFEVKNPLVQDPASIAYVNDIGKKLGVSEPIKVVDTPGDAPFAAAMTFGQIYVNPRMIELLSEPELAAVLAHEISHVDLGHTKIVSGLGYKLFPSYARSMETAADSTAIQKLAKAGYDPNAYASALTKIQQDAASRGIEFSAHRHPPMEDRIADSQKSAARQQIETIAEKAQSSLDNLKAKMKALDDASTAVDNLSKDANADPAELSAAKDAHIKALGEAADAKEMAQKDIDEYHKAAGDNQPEEGPSQPMQQASQAQSSNLYESWEKFRQSVRNPVNNDKLPAEQNPTTQYSPAPRTLIDKATSIAKDKAFSLYKTLVKTPYGDNLWFDKAGNLTDKAKSRIVQMGMSPEDVAKLTQQEASTIIRAKALTVDSKLYLKNRFDTPLKQAMLTEVLRDPAIAPDLVRSMSGEVSGSEMRIWGDKQARLAYLAKHGLVDRFLDTWDKYKAAQINDPSVTWDSIRKKSDFYDPTEGNWDYNKISDMVKGGVPADQILSVMLAKSHLMGALYMGTEGLPALRGSVPKIVEMMDSNTPLPTKLQGSTWPSLQDQWDSFVKAKQSYPNLTWDEFVNPNKAPKPAVSTVSEYRANNNLENAWKGVKDQLASRAVDVANDAARIETEQATARGEAPSSLASSIGQVIRNSSIYKFFTDSPLAKEMSSKEFASGEWSSKAFDPDKKTGAIKTLSEAGFNNDQIKAILPESVWGKIDPSAGGKGIFPSDPDFAPKIRSIVGQGNMKYVARGVINDILDRVISAKHGWLDNKAFKREWDSVSPETKSALYTPEQVKEIGNFIDYTVRRNLRDASWLEDAAGKVRSAVGRLINKDYGSGPIANVADKGKYVFSKYLQGKGVDSSLTANIPIRNPIGKAITSATAGITLAKTLGPAMLLGPTSLTSAVGPVITEAAALGGNRFLARMLVSRGGVNNLTAAIARRSGTGLVRPWLMSLKLDDKEALRQIAPLAGIAAQTAKPKEEDKKPDIPKPTSTLQPILMKSIDKGTLNSKTLKQEWTSIPDKVKRDSFDPKVADEIDKFVNIASRRGVRDLTWLSKAGADPVNGLAAVLATRGGANTVLRASMPDNFSSTGTRVGDPSGRKAARERILASIAKT